MVKEKDTLTMIEKPSWCERVGLPSLTIQGIGCFTSLFDKEPNPCEYSYILIYCDYGKGFYRYKGKYSVIETGQYMIIKESDEFSCTTYRSAKQMRLFVFSFCYNVHYTITTKTPNIVLTDINSRIHGGRNIFMRAYYMLSLDNVSDNLPYASALLMSFIEAERYVRNEQISVPSDKSEIVEKAIQFMYDNMQENITIADLLSFLGCSRSKLFNHFMKYKAARPLDFLNKIRIKRACKLLTDTNLRINEICKNVGVNNQVYFSRLFTKIVGMSPTEYRKSTHLEKI